MTPEELSKLTDQELLEMAKKLKSTTIINALLIGFMIGVIIYSIAKNTVGFFTLIPLFFIYKINKSKNYDALKKVLNERGLK
ncbi:FUSC family protein [Lacinutrix iliipiscaria]|uniref:FUSC family protein n=1 Tax=Lacinutrix iliipiscaria TaxID=1230532 RepID=A0ABW5WNC4_9FLAO